MSDLTRCRIGLLAQFDDYVREKIGDEEIIDYWFEQGVPDKARFDDLRAIAEYDDIWLDCVQAFAKCCKMAGILN